MKEKKSKKEIYSLAPLTIVTVVAENENEIVVKNMTYEKGLKLKQRKTSYKYTFYQIGFCSIKPTKK